MYPYRERKIFLNLMLGVGDEGNYQCIDGPSKKDLMKQIFTSDVVGYQLDELTHFQLRSETFVYFLGRWSER